VPDNNLVWFFTVVGMLAVCFSVSMLGLAFVLELWASALRLWIKHRFRKLDKIADEKKQEDDW